LTAVKRPAIEFSITMALILPDSIAAGSSASVKPAAPGSERTGRNPLLVVASAPQRDIQTVSNRWRFEMSAISKPPGSCAG
jgi:hypothetical protein